jgi:DNA-binding transcriptional ArsR family regulator
LTSPLQARAEGSHDGVTGATSDNRADPDGFGGDAEAAARAVQLLKALSHEGRLQILCLLLDREMAVADLSEALEVSQPTASQHLMRLRAEGFVATRRDGKSVYYRLLRQDIMPIITALRDLFCARPI